MRILRISGKKGQATTEMVLLFPVFMILMFALVKTFALLVLIQKLEISSYYAARRWQLESHHQTKYMTWDQGWLRNDIEDNVKEYLGFKSRSIKGFLNLKDAKLSITRTAVWNVVTLQITTNPSGVKLLCKYNRNRVCGAPFGLNCQRGYNYLCTSGGALTAIKYVPNRDRPIQFELPGLQ